MLQTAVKKSLIFYFRVFLFFLQISVHQCITYLYSDGRKPHEPTGLHALHAARKVAGFSEGPHLK